MNTKPYLFLIAFGLFYATAFAQDLSNELKSVSASGGNATGTTGSASYTVGQVFYTTAAGSDGSVAMGVQQAFDISVDTSVENTKDILLSCSLYPNPASEYIILNIDNEKWKNVSYQLFDSQGKLLETKQISETETSILLSNYLSSTYFLRITNGNKLIKTFKIVKN
jgi:hypothetical protein